MAKRKIQILIALIHNYNQKRYSYIHSNLLDLKKKLEKNYDVHYLEIARQPKIERLSFSKTILRKIQIWKLSREFSSYREYNPRNIILDIIILVHRFFATYINKNWETKKAATDIIVTDKHLRLWNAFVEKDCDLLICFEDDAIFLKNSVSKLKSCLNDAVKFNKKPVYLYLGGGNPVSMLGDKHLLIKQLGYKRFHKKPITNTASCYLLNYLSVEIFIPVLLQGPPLRFLAIDHLLNKLFIKTAPKNKFFSYHANPPVFAHGSIEGNYKSWIENKLKT